MTAGAFVLGVSAWLYVSKRHQHDRLLYRKGIRLGAWVTLFAAVVVSVSGDYQGKIMTEVQPMKMAAAEALWNTSDSCAPFSVLTIGTRDGKHEKWALEVPCVLSFLGTGTFGGRVEGIYDLQDEYRQQYGADRESVASDSGDYTPIIPVTYWSFRWMMGLGAAGAAGAALILWLTREGRTPAMRWFAPVALAVPIFVLLSNSMGWIFTEMGRQPWVVFGVMTTANAVSPGVSAVEAWISLGSLTLLYLVLAIVEVGLLVKVIKKGPDDFVEPPSPKWRQEHDPDAADRPLDFAY
jgi:cytochrome bd ubiquinol oxidase subunit I